MARPCDLVGVPISFTRRDHVPAERCWLEPDTNSSALGARILHCVDPVNCKAMKAKESTER